jgi:hypothetical protein
MQHSTIFDDLNTSISIEFEKNMCVKSKTIEIVVLQLNPKTNSVETLNNQSKEHWFQEDESQIQAFRGAPSRGDCKNAE